MPKIYLTLANSSKERLMVQIEPEGADFWLLSNEEFELRAEAESGNGRFEVQYRDGCIAVYPSAGVGYISVFKKETELECGHNRPANSP
jgi:hypothetical protein